MLSEDDYFAKLPYNTCGDFTERFNRTWLIHKTFAGPITLLVGAQNNSGNNLSGGADGASLAYYDRLTAAYDIYLLVGDTEGDINNSTNSNPLYKAVIPMEFVNGEYQCSYEFTNTDTYISFGCIPSEKGCVGDPRGVFPGIKTFLWSSWTSKTNPTTTPATGYTYSRLIPTDGTPIVDYLGDNITARSQAKYDVGVRANRGYPRGVTVNSATMGKSSLQVQRRGRINAAEVTMTVGFTYPVVPTFCVSALDGLSDSREQIQVIGSCSGSEFIPTLNYVGDPTKARYIITGNTATVNRSGSVSSTDKNGMFTTEFRGSVDTVMIKYRITNKTTNSTRSIFISPFRLTSIQPPPPVNEAGLSFSKRSNVYELSTCEMSEVTYTFEIRNANCRNITIENFADTLPAHMSWEAGTFFLLDSVSSGINPLPYFNPQIKGADGRILEIDSLAIPAGRSLQFRATAQLEDDIVTGAYANQASFDYLLTKNNTTTRQRGQSFDYFYSNTGVPATVINVTKGVPAALVDVQTRYSAASYKQNSTVDVTYTFDNPNDSIPLAFLNINFNEEFTVSNVVITTNITPTTDPTYPKAYFDNNAANNNRGILNIAGITVDDGFTLPPGVTTVKFTLTAPANAFSMTDPFNLNNLQAKNYDAAGNPINDGLIADLNISYGLSSETDDMCLLKAIPDEGTKAIPYSKGRVNVITNKFITGKSAQ